MSKVAGLLVSIGRKAAETTRLAMATPEERATTANAKAKKRQVTAAREHELAPRSDGSIRLNLGCGDKILRGYVNIDIAPARKDMVPDVVCDLRKLTLPDCHADEAMAIHVIEHFYLWEVAELLQEWRRVLKPGGRLILECPNLLEAARQLVANPDLAAAGKEWSTTMFPLYGDPGWKDPLMCHRWGWTPGSLKSEMEEAGFINVHEGMPLYKKGAPRDMRVIGERPR